MNLASIKPNERVEGKYVVKFKKPVQPYAKGFKFELRIGDATKEVMLKYWGGADSVKVNKLYDSISQDDVIQIKGVSSLYNDNIEISVNEDSGQIHVCAPSEYNISDFVKTTSKDIDSMLNSLKSKIQSLKNPELKKVSEAFFFDKDFTDKFSKAPAAMYKHHNHVGGLLEHTLDVVNICEDVMKCHPELDRDLVVTGALLHDVGKIDEFKVSTSIRATTSSMLLGHITRGLELFGEKTKEMDLPEELRIKLKHIIISHHGNAQYGSPKPPAFPEAMLIHMVDNLDATIELMIREKENAQTEDEQVYTKDFGNVYLR